MGAGALGRFGTSGRDRAGELRCVVSRRHGNFVSVPLRTSFTHTARSLKAHFTSQGSQVAALARQSASDPSRTEFTRGGGGPAASPGRERERRDTPRSLTLVYQGKPPRSRSTRWMVLSCESERDGTKGVSAQNRKSRSRALGGVFGRATRHNADAPAQCHNRQSSCGRRAASRQR